MRGESTDEERGEDGDEKTSTSCKYRLSWASLLSRIFQIEIETCSLCGGKMKVVAAVTDPASINRYLEGTGQSAKIPELVPARAPPQLEFEY